MARILSARDSLTAWKEPSSERAGTVILTTQDCFKIAKQIIFLGLYKGLWPSVVKSGLATGLHFYIYEEILSMFAKTNF